MYRLHLLFLYYEMEGVLDKKHNGRVCKECEHFAVCQITRHVVVLLNEYGEDIKPFQLDDLAKICRYYSNMDQYK